MHKNMRRSIAVAATATGMWALGTAAASAAELPVSVPLSTPDLGAETPDATDVVEDVTDTEVVKEAKAVTVAKAVDRAGDAKDTLTKAGNKAAEAVEDASAADVRDSLPSQAPEFPQTAEVPQLGDVQQLPGAGHLPDTQLPDAQLSDVQFPGAGIPDTQLPDAQLSDVQFPGAGIPDTQLPDARFPDAQIPAAPVDEIDYLFGPIEQIPGYAQSQVPTAVQGALAEAGPVVEQTSDSVLPPLAAGVVGVAVPVVGQAVGDVGTLAQGVVGEVGPFAQGVASEVQPLAQGLTGDAVAPFAQGVTTRVQPLAEGVGAQARPFAGGLTDTVRGDARPAVAHAAAGAQGLTSVTPSFVTDALPGR
ncbi:hypothetical protein JHN50_31400 [Streptomyces sp. MBT98]|uniref:hypothetical protein n=1 Tax=unclassified Streptomyces TaxID=2593676 RepID=UPI00190E0695|nr:MULTISPECIES: hypothetical protein [unclassified Streptomyces]MBK3601157.1 hypothetical protein [Streptomyces sp. MBT54]MBK3619096.1 hypothetical protein [Streptomyces sp. MBT98]MBK6046250.1 hypothetical protein [Streptomyces sp. MBT55]